MNSEIKNIAGYKKKILDCVDDSDRLKVDRLIDSLVLDVTEVNLMRVKDMTSVLGQTIGNSTNDMINMCVAHEELNS